MAWLRDDHERKRLDWIRERATKLPEGTAVLDIGFDVPAHREIFAHCQYNFFDLRALLESARDSKQAGRYRIPVPDQSFDVVLGNSVFEWALRPEDALAEVGRGARRRAASCGSLRRRWPHPQTRRLGPALPSALPGTTATFAKQGLEEIGDAFGSAWASSAELSATCIEAGERLEHASTSSPTRRLHARGESAARAPAALRRPRAANAVRVPAREHHPGSAPSRCHRSSRRDLAGRRAGARAKAEPSVRARVGKRPLRQLTYLITSILGVTGRQRGAAQPGRGPETTGPRGGHRDLFPARPTWTEIVRKRPSRK